MPSARVREQGGRVHGFQIWVNLPARDKMTSPRYQDVTAAKLPIATTPDGKVTVKVIAGSALGVDAAVETRTPIEYFDVTLEPGGSVVLPAPASFNAAVYVFDGAARVGTDHDVESGGFVLLGEGDSVAVANAADAKAPARLLVLGGEPLNEPVARYGPFVMNTEAEIHQAIRDYQSGNFGDIRR
jgi:redox-sensitive bicupin YhaK (pirin superfamily)